MESVLGRVIDAHGAALDGGEAIAELQTAELPPPANAPRGGQLWETGIKVIDCFAPIPLGGVVALEARPGVGLMALVTELTQRIAAQRGGCAVTAALDDLPYPTAEAVSGMREGGVDQATALITGPVDSAPAEREQLARAALITAEALAAAGRDVLLFLDDGLLLPETAELLRGRARATDHGSLTILCCFWRHTTPEPALAPEVTAALGPADSTIVFRRELARQGIWPAIDPLASRARLISEGGVGADHVELVRAAHRLLREGAGSERAQAILHLGAQPFFVAEAYTARQGSHVTYAETLRAYGALVRS